MSESSQKKVGRVRPPKTHITLDVETYGAQEKKELPFVVGVMGDFSGQPSTPLEPIEERKFVEIDRYSFNRVMSRMEPELHFQVDNVLQEDDSTFPVDLTFNQLEDFEPESIVNQVEPLKQLLAIRDHITELERESNKDPRFEALLENILSNPNNITQLMKEFNQQQEAEQTNE